MGRPKSQFRAARSRPIQFLDRVDEFGAIHDHVALLRSDPTHLKVFAVVGLAGVGKTRFLLELRERLGVQKRSHLVWVSLASEAATTSVGPLRVIRDQLGFDCLLFDAALLTFWAATGQPLQTVGGRGRAKSLAMRSVEVGGALATFPLPLTFAADLYAGVDRAVTRRRHYERAEFEVIDALREQPVELFTRLPHYLGLDIERRLRHAPAPLVCFYDAYDKQAARTISEDAPWLRELIASAGHGVHLITTRGQLGWDAHEWEGTLQPIALGALPEAECRRMIRTEVGDLGSEVEDRLLQASHQLPFFLQAAIDVCRAHIDDQGGVTAADLPRTPAAAIEYMLDHFEPPARTLAVILACLQYFDDELYGYLVRTLNLQISVTEVDEFVQWFFIGDGGHGLFKTHDLLTDCVRQSSTLESTKLRAMRCATEHLAMRVVASTPEEIEAALELYHALFAAWQAIESVPQAAAETLIDIGYHFYDAGYWHALSMLPIGRDRSSGPHAASIVTQFFAALSTRRTAGSVPALRALELLEPDRSHMGRHASSFDLEVAYMSELVGNYAKAREDFRLLNAAAEPFDPARRDHVRSRLYHADMMVMDGLLVDASRLLLEASEAVGPAATMTWVELVRHRGHAYRFSFVTDVAEQLYLRALQVGGESPSMRGKLQTNLAETRCWSLPWLAVDDARLAAQLNEEIGNPLEVAKCDAARAIALARLGDFDRAREAGEQSYRRFATLHYPAGVAFAFQARAVLEALAGRREDAKSHYRSLAAAIDTLGTYRHLAVMPAWLLGDRPEFARAAEDVQWIQAERLEARLAYLLALPDERP